MRKTLKVLKDFCYFHMEEDENLVNIPQWWTLSHSHPGMYSTESTAGPSMAVMKPSSHESSTTNACVKKTSDTAFTMLKG